jgi:hypothetical protein
MIEQTSDPSLEDVLAPMTEPLKVDTDGLDAASAILKSAAGQIPTQLPQVLRQRKRPVVGGHRRGIGADGSTHGGPAVDPGERHHGRGEDRGGRAAVPRDLLDSESVTRILTTPQRTLIAQLTLTALLESPVDRNNIGLAVTCDVADAAAENH